MAMMRYEPWQMMNQLSRELSRFVDTMPAGPEGTTDSATSDWTPAVDIKEEEDRFILHADVPGVKPEDIEVTMENGVLTIRGERHTESREERAGYRRVERMGGRFYRRFSLPDSADAEKITARCHDGELEVAIPKQAKVMPRRIAVKS
ncbi:MAG: Hsp20/alpha crystallin family protein [Gammaproteobacteria bacterium]|jgi:HSP20 family protein